MVQDYNVIVYAVVSNHKYAKIIIPQILSQSCVDQVIILAYAEDSYAKSYLQTVALEYDDKVSVVNLKNAKGFQSSISDYFKTKNHQKNEVVVYFSSDICFISPNTIEDLAKFTIDNPEYEMNYPTGINTERTTYFMQVTNHLLPKLFWRWDNEYLDEYSFKNTKSQFHEDIHIGFIEEATNFGFALFDFGNYIINKKEIAPKYAFATIGDTLTNHFKSKNLNVFLRERDGNGVIVGSALCSVFANEKHRVALEKTNLLSKYQIFGEKIYSQISDDLNEPSEDNISEMDTGFPIGVIFGEDKNEFDIKIAISSHVSTQNKTVPILLKSLLDADIDAENILVVVGGANREYVERKNGILYSYVMHNSFDHTALIDIVEKGWRGNWWFLMHDTTKAGPKFKEKLTKIGPKSSHVSALKEGWMNMGLFSRKVINDMRNYIIQLKNCNKMQAILSEKIYSRLSESTYYDIVEQINFPYYGDIYGDGIDRQVMHMPTIDLYKFQSFHYHSESTRKLIDEWVK